jgi:hypothetical protein
VFAEPKIEQHTRNAPALRQGEWKNENIRLTAFALKQFCDPLYNAFHNNTEKPAHTDLKIDTDGQT